MAEKEIDFKENHFVSDALKKQINLLYKIESDHLIQHKIIQAAGKLVGIYRNKRKLLLCGNGGSVAQAQHLATELVSRFYLDRRPPGLKCRVFSGEHIFYYIYRK